MIRAMLIEMLRETLLISTFYQARMKKCTTMLTCFELSNDSTNQCLSHQVNPTNKILKLLLSKQNLSVSEKEKVYS